MSDFLSNYSKSKAAADSDKAAIAAGCVAVLLLIPLVLVLSTLFILFGWNIGLVPAVAAAGGTLAKINFGTAFGLAVLVSALSRLFNHPELNLNKE